MVFVWLIWQLEIDHAEEKLHLCESLRKRQGRVGRCDTKPWPIASIHRGLEFWQDEYGICIHIFTQYTQIHITHYTLHITHYTLHITQYTLHNTQYTIHNTHYTITIHITQYTLHITHYNTQYTTHTIHNTQYTLHITHYTQIHNTQYTIHNTHYTLHITHYTQIHTKWLIRSIQRWIVCRRVTRVHWSCWQSLDESFSKKGRFFSKVSLFVWFIFVLFHAYAY